MELQDHLNDRQAFEMALLRARMRNKREGKSVSQQELLKQATAELENEHQRLTKQISQLPPER
jgi:hypothetical protein